MAVNYVFTDTIKVPGLPTMPSDAPITIPGNDSNEVEQVVNPGESKHIAMPGVTQASIAAFVFHSDQANVTVNTNAADATGGNSFALGSAKAISWNNTLTYANPITHDITGGVWVINNAAKATTFRCGFLLNV